jgi:hypothetical protein
LDPVIGGNLLPEGGVARVEGEDGLDEAAVWGMPAGEEEQLLEVSALTVVLLGLEVVERRHVQQPWARPVQAAVSGTVYGLFRFGSSSASTIDTTRLLKLTDLTEL